ncbi:MAG: SPOR domain-containing protein, partial [Burkholderiales bacterium]
KNKSSLIRLTEEAKKKARRSLIGSIFMLLVALVILLNVTARVKPIPVIPKTIEVKNNASNVLANKPLAASEVTAASANSASITATSNVTQITSSSPTLTASAATKSVITNVEPTNNSGFKAGVISQDSPAKIQASHPSKTFRPQIVSETITHKPTPEDILNGKVGASTIKHYFIQLLATSDQTKLAKIKQDLAHQGITTATQAVTTENGTLYRLRIGPFTNPEAAHEKLTTLNNNSNLEIGPSN